MFTPPHARPSLLLLTLATLACACSDRCGGGAGADAAPASSGSGSAAVGSAATSGAGVNADGAAGKACALGGPIQVVDKAVRTDAGITIVTLADGRIAVGYATGKGEPAAAILEQDGKATVTEVPTAGLPRAPAKPGSRVIERVTPLGFGDGGLAMHAALDVLDITADASGEAGAAKSESLRCGPTDDKPLASSADAAAMRDCRTVWGSDEAHTFALASLVKGDTVEWRMLGGGAASGAESLLYEAKFTAEKLVHPARYLFQVPVAAFAPASGMLLAAREDGGLVIARRDASLAPFGKTVRYWHGAATTMPAVALRDVEGAGHVAAVYFSLQGQRDLYGETFSMEAKDIPRPDKIALDDPAPPADGERSSVSVGFFPKGDVLVGFADGKAGARRGRVAVLSRDNKTLVPPADLAGDVSELRVIALADGHALLVWIGAHDGMQALRAAPITCPME